MKIVMLDTNVLRDLIKNEAKAKEKLAEFKNYTFAISFFRLCRCSKLIRKPAAAPVSRRRLVS
jgi:hypothetical protein